jgi:hypothetical protein
VPERSDEVSPCSAKTEEKDELFPSVTSFDEEPAEALETPFAAAWAGANNIPSPDDAALSDIVNYLNRIDAMNSEEVFARALPTLATAPTIDQLVGNPAS